MTDLATPRSATGAATSPQDVDREFVDLVGPLRGELTAHCYRMLGSVHEAEDLVQETYLRAWRAFHGFEGRSSVRTWMYQIATNTCLTALQGRARRPLPTGLGAPVSDPTGALEARPEISWLEPLPDRVIAGTAPVDPAAAAVSSDTIRIAFIAALQFLTPTQRAVLILRDVLAWHAAEVATLLDTSVAAVNSSLQRARAQVAKMAPLDEFSSDLVVDDPEVQAQLDRYVTAFEAYDIDEIVAMLAKDVVWDMPPFTGWYQGAEAVGRLIENNCPASKAGDMRLLPTSANGQPAFGVYMREDDGVWRAFHLQQLTFGEQGVERVTAYFDTALFPLFDLPTELDA
ncbi:sigma-70 family RNA polymerase sigma factor [Lapillicoccus sp.]|uniref:sigma-70 family RNA polymerase sigma factor n=1 Tax=Lapillicoccus sp. TaxID=1909287 RepID=UPI003266FD0D